MRCRCGSVYEESLGPHRRCSGHVPAVPSAPPQAVRSPKRQVEGMQRSVYRAQKCTTGAGAHLSAGRNGAASPPRRPAPALNRGLPCATGRSLAAVGGNQYVAILYRRPRIPLSPIAPFPSMDLSLIWTALMAFLVINAMLLSASILACPSAKEPSPVSPASRRVSHENSPGASPSQHTLSEPSRAFRPSASLQGA